MPLYNRDIGTFHSTKKIPAMQNYRSNIPAPPRNGHRDRDQLVPQLRRSHLLASPVQSVQRVRSLHLVRRVVHHRRNRHSPVSIPDNEY